MAMTVTFVAPTSKHIEKLAVALLRYESHSFGWIMLQKPVDRFGLEWGCISPSLAFWKALF